MSRVSDQGGGDSGILMTLTNMGLIAPRVGASDLWWLEAFGPRPEGAKRKPGREPEEGDKDEEEQEEADAEEDEEDDEEEEEEEEAEEEEDDVEEEDEEDFGDDELSSDRPTGKQLLVNRNFFLPAPA